MAKKIDFYQGIEKSLSGNDFLNNYVNNVLSKIPEEHRSRVYDMVDFVYQMTILTGKRVKEDKQHDKELADIELADIEESKELLEYFFQVHF